ncbi:hypothetical protein FB45DRAFT_1066404 [Roridomyces roridus]|uniref:Uncharacterized protein n=1 Tax=Roridomyces roridus TaxID=1738132 RepID=A0AAD7B4G8_9AGAR|nr:hypothetical protein FB45DRAFT_1066404 [Roridomyces roridus]
MAPTSNDLELIPCMGCTSYITPGTIIFVFFCLTFYALALWDRYLHLKLRESQRLQQPHAEPKEYGATRVIVLPRPRAPAVQLTTPSSPRPGKEAEWNVPPISKEPQFLCPPPISKDENPPPLFSSRVN